MWRVDSLEKTLMMGGVGGRRRRGQPRMRWLDGITDSMDMSLNSRSWWWTGRPGVLRFMGSQRVGHDWATELNWTEPELEQFRSEQSGASSIWMCWNWGLSQSTLGFRFMKKTKTSYTVNFYDPTRDLLTNYLPHFPDGIIRNNLGLWGNALRIYAPSRNYLEIFS